MENRPDPLEACMACSYLEEDDDGFVWIVCGCERRIGPAPDTETAIDMAMSHAWEMGALFGRIHP